MSYVCLCSAPAWCKTVVFDAIHQTRKETGRGSSTPVWGAAIARSSWGHMSYSEFLACRHLVKDKVADIYNAPLDEGHPDFSEERAWMDNLLGLHPNWISLLQLSEVVVCPSKTQANMFFFTPMRADVGDFKISKITNLTGVRRAITAALNQGKGK